MKRKFSLKQVRFQQVAIFLCGVAFLIGTWKFLWFVFAFLTECLLVPWDDLGDRPPVGTLARTINDFFEGSPGDYIPSTVFTVANVSLFLLQFRYTTNKVLLPFVFAITNLLFFLITLLLLFANNLFSYSLTNILTSLGLLAPSPINDVGFHLTAPGILTVPILVILLFFVQTKLSILLPRGRGFIKKV